MKDWSGKADGSVPSAHAHTDTDMLSSHRKNTEGYQVHVCHMLKDSHDSRMRQWLSQDKGCF